MSNPIKFIIVTLVAMGALGLSPSLRAACARQVTLIDQNSSQCEIYQGFGITLPPECGTMAAKAPVSVGCTRSLHMRPAKKTIAVQINFEFNSSELDAASRSILDKIASVLLKPASFEAGLILEGHTDAVGSQKYNLPLSERRAKAAFEYLTQHHGIERSRLSVEGKGKTNLLFPQDPTAAANRRVEFVERDR